MDVPDEADWNSLDKDNCLKYTQRAKGKQQELGQKKNQKMIYKQQDNISKEKL